MLVCVCVSVYVCVSECVYVCMCVLVCALLRMCVCVCACTNATMCVCVCVCVCAYVCVRVHVCEIVRLYEKENINRRGDDLQSVRVQAWRAARAGRGNLSSAGKQSMCPDPTSPVTRTLVQSKTPKRSGSRGS